jgi:hypothetical protein
VISTPQASLPILLQLCRTTTTTIISTLHASSLYCSLPDNGYTRERIYHSTEVTDASPSPSNVIDHQPSWQSPLFVDRFVLSLSSPPEYSAVSSAAVPAVKRPFFSCRNPLALLCRQSDLTCPRRTARTGRTGEPANRASLIRAR